MAYIKMVTVQALEVTVTYNQTLHTVTPNISQYFPTNAPENITIYTGVQGQNLRQPLSVWYSPHAHLHNGPVNQAISRLVEGQLTGQLCRGVVIVLRYSGIRCLSYKNVVKEDLEHIAAYFSTLTFV